MYIYQQKKWPHFEWDHEAISAQLIPIKFDQGRLLGKMDTVGFELQEQATLQTIINDITQTSEIEGEHLNQNEVRSSVARHLGIDAAGLIPSTRNVDGIVEMHLDATQNHAKTLTKKRLCQWHALLFPTGLSGLTLLNPGYLRTDSDGPMQVVSGAYGREKIHYQAPPADRLNHELKLFIDWFNGENCFDPIIKSAIAHLWFVTLHPFEDGNGRLARAIADMALAQADNLTNRYYSMSTQIRHERKSYYQILESTQKNSLDITAWLTWFMNCLDRAIKNSDEILENVLSKAKFWEQHRAKIFNQRQLSMLNILFDGFKGKLTSSKWAKMTKCSQDTASRDIKQLINYDILIKADQGGRSTHYILRDYPINDITS